MRRARMEFGDRRRDQGRLPPGARRALVRRDDARPALRASNDGQNAGLHRCGRRVARARHRRQHRDLQPDGRGDVAHAARARSAGARIPRRTVGASRTPARARTTRCSIATGISATCSTGSLPTAALASRWPRQTGWKASPACGSAAIFTACSAFPWSLGRGFAAEIDRSKGERADRRDQRRVLGAPLQPRPERAGTPAHCRWPGRHHRRRHRARLSPD